MKYFTLSELLVTNSKLSNIPTWNAVDNLRALVINVLDPLRAQYGKPIHVNSGYRSAEVNKAVGGSPTSDHLCLCTAAAADITCDNNRLLYDLIIKSGIPFKQLINEHNFLWLHVSFDKNNNKRETLCIN